MHSSGSPKHVGVIGGGITGLAAAHALRKRDPSLRVTLHESAPRLGGVIKTTDQDGFLIEAAADGFTTTSPDTGQLCKDLGLGDELIQTRPGGGGTMVFTGGKLQPLPPGFADMASPRLWPMIAAKVLSPKGKLRSGLEAVVPRKIVDDESLKSFVCRRFGAEMFDRLVQPLVGGIYAADPARLSVATTMPRFLDMERKHGSFIRGMIADRRNHKNDDANDGGPADSQFMSLRGGMSGLIEALGQSLSPESIQLDSRIDRLTHSESGWSICREDGQTTQADAVIVATPANHSAHMLRETDRKIARRLRNIPYASCAVVSLAFRRDQIGTPISSFGFVVPHVENHSILTCSFSSEKYVGRAPDGTVLMRVYIGGAMQPELLRMADEQLLDLAHSELAKVLKIDGQPTFRDLERQTHAMPQYHVGHNQRVSEIVEQLEEHPTLALAGSALSAVGVPGCIESGQEAAARIFEQLRVVPARTT